MPGDDDDPVEPCCKKSARNSTSSNEEGFICMDRVKKLPLVESTRSMISGFYSSFKASHCIINTMFSNLEDGLHKGVEVVAPVTAKISETLDRPLKAVDSAICVGLDFIEEKIPSMKLPPQQMYENTKNYLKCVLSPAIEYGSSIYGNVKDKYKEMAKEEMCTKTTNKPRDNETTKKSKVDK